MISDALSEACDDIEYYLEELPEVYAHCLDEVRLVYEAMRRLQRKLENPLGHWDYQAPTPCLHCGLRALDHDVLEHGLGCPVVTGSVGTTFTLTQEPLA